MEINVTNNIPNVNVVINKTSDGGYSILLTEENRRRLGSVKPGETIRIGEREYIVLGHSGDTTAIITKKFVKKMSFGSSGDYRNSDVRSYLNGEFYNELKAAVGKENIIQHTVNLMADDGTGKGITCKDNVSLLTADLYRRYREFLPAYGEWWWLATRVNADNGDYARRVCYVYSYGTLDWCVCGYGVGVRPFSILNSSTIVS